MPGWIDCQLPWCYCTHCWICCIGTRLISIWDHKPGTTYWPPPAELVRELHFDHLSSQVSTRTSYHRMVQTIWGLQSYCLWFGWSKALHHQDNMYMIVARPDRGHCAYHNVQTENGYVWFWSLVCQSNQRNICVVYVGARWAKSVCPRSQSHTSCLVRSCPMMFFSSLLVIGCNNKV